MRAASAFDTILPAARIMPLRTRVSVSVAIATAGQVEEGGFKFCTDLGFSTATLSETKSAVIAVYSNELARLSGPEGFATIESSLRAGLSRATDQIFIAGLSAGVVATPSAGDPLGDIKQVALAIESDAGARHFAIVSPLTCKKIALSADTNGSPMFPAMTVSGGQIAGVTVTPSDGIADDQILGVDASQLAMNGGTVQLDASAEALADLDTESGSTGVTSLWQSNQIGARLERVLGFQPMRAAAVALIDGMNYGTGS